MQKAKSADLTFMDRAFYSGAAAFSFKPAAAVSSTYWNHVYGAQPEEVTEDKEGLMTMYNIGKNMARMLKCIALGKENGLAHPDNEKVLTNFIR